VQTPNGEPTWRKSFAFTQVDPIPSISSPIQQRRAVAKVPPVEFSVGPIVEMIDVSQAGIGDAEAVAWPASGVEEG
jgi:hypothetical protein